MSSSGSTLLFLSISWLFLGCASSGSAPHSPEEGGSGKGGATAAGTTGVRAEGKNGGDAEGGEELGQVGQGSAAAKEGSSIGAGKQRVRAPRPKMSGRARTAYDSGRKAFLAGDLLGAQTQYRGSTEADKKAYEAFYSLGVVLERLGSSEQAKMSYKRALLIVPDHEASIAAYAALLMREGHQDEAWSFLQAKAKKEGKNSSLLASMAEVKSLKGESGRAQELAEESLKLDPSNTAAMVTLARDHYRARRIDLSLYALKGILDGYGAGNPPRDKRNAEARLLRGLIYTERGLRGPAMEEMKAAVEERVDLVDAHLVLANYMMEAGNARDAKPHLEMAIRYDNRNIGAHLQLGDAYRLLDRPDDARRELEWVLASRPGHPPAHYNLALLYLLGGSMKGVSESDRITRAIAHLEAYKGRAKRGGPDDVDDLITRAKTKHALLRAQQEQEMTGGGS